MREITTQGWTVTTTESFRINSISKFQTVRHWVDFHTRNPDMKGPGRLRCSCCNKDWKNIEPGHVWLCMMNGKRNQVICDKCVENFKEFLIERDK